MKEQALANEKNKQKIGHVSHTATRGKVKLVLNIQKNKWIYITNRINVTLCVN